MFYLQVLFGAKLFVANLIIHYFDNCDFPNFDNFMIFQTVRYSCIHLNDIFMNISSQGRKQGQCPDFFEKKKSNKKQNKKRQDMQS